MLWKCLLVVVIDNILQAGLAVMDIQNRKKSPDTFGWISKNLASWPSKILKIFACCAEKGEYSKLSTRPSFSRYPVISQVPYLQGIF